MSVSFIDNNCGTVQTIVTESGDGFERGLVKGLQLGDKRRRLDTEKTPAAYAASIINSLGDRYREILHDGHGLEGAPFLSEEELVGAYASVKNNSHERHLVAFMMPLFRDKILSSLPSHYDLVNSEEYAWVPQSAGIIVNMIAPDLFIAPTYLVSYRKPYKNAPNAGVNAEYGEFQHHLARSSICNVLDGKVEVNNKAIGEFVKYLEILSWPDGSADSMHCRGIVFDAVCAYLVKAYNGYVTAITRIHWATPGSLGFIQNFATSAENIDDPWNVALTWACTACDISLNITCSQELAADQKRASCALGVGAIGRVFRVTTSEGTHVALKVVQGASACAELRRQYELTRKMPAAAETYALSVIPGSLRESSLDRDPFVPLLVAAFLMPTVGQPLEHVEDITRPVALEVLNALSSLRRTR